MKREELLFEVYRVSPDLSRAATCISTLLYTRLHNSLRGTLLWYYKMPSLALTNQQSVFRSNVLWSRCQEHSTKQTAGSD